MKHLVIILFLSKLASIHGRIHSIPPRPAFSGHYTSQFQRLNAAKSVDRWRPEDRNYPWEVSGLMEGDIMLPDEHERRNAMESESRRWPNATVTYFVQEKHFTPQERKKIQRAMDEFHRRTCVRFKPYTKGDPTYIWITGEKGGCWSYIGRISNSKHKGQKLNLQPPRCLNRGTIMHEFLHALGFHHQHSAANRDQYIKILWENLKPGSARDFNTRPTKDFSVGYDYNSIMHYSTFANSKNMQKTIVPKDPNARIGQRRGLSRKDIIKLSKMYHCKKEKGQWKFY